ncbi:MAG: hypothetical protein JMDDDDMK_04854 [Acidobacteria bacterium]|nr:hypothetical protein [Acidobacteriota bacterium]
MAFTPATPIAVTLPPSEYPYRFTELVHFRGDFDESIMPGETVNPKGVAYHPRLDRLLVSLSPYHGDVMARTQTINTVAFNGSRARFAPDYQMFRRVESKIAIVPESGPPVDAGFTPGDVFIGRGPQTEISRLSANGDVIADNWVGFGDGGGMWGGICFDTEGEFGGRMIAVEANGKIYLVNPDGSFTLHFDLVMRLEGVEVAPATFGPFAKQMIIGVEGYSDDDPHGGEIYAISKDGERSLLANIGYAAEDIRFIPPNGGTYFQTQLCFDRERENRLLSVSSSQFLNRLGRMIVVNEMTGELWEVAWDGARYTQQQVGCVPGRWSTAGFYVQGTELEAGCFAVKTPRIPNWTDWQLAPGGFTTDQAPAAATDAFDQIVLFAKGLSDREIYLNSTQARDQQLAANRPEDPLDGREWRGWRRDSAGLTTPHALACTRHNNRMYAFAAQSDGRILHKFYNAVEDELTIQPWEEVPGGLLTNTGCACATVNGRLVVCAIGADRGIYLNELAPGGRYWSGWYSIPGGGGTDVTPTVATFQDELYVFIKGLYSNRILLKARTIDGDWTPWAEVPGAGRTDAPISAVTTEGQLFLFLKGVDQRPYVNVASDTGAWSGWNVLPNSGVTNTALAPAALGNRVALFAKGIDDQRLYVRSTV